MVPSGFSVRHKRARRWFDGSVGRTGIHEAVLTPMVVVNRRNRPVLVASSNKNSFAEKNVGKGKESRAYHAAIGLRDSV